MEGIILPSLEPRLQKRFQILVKSHLRSAPQLAAGISSLPSAETAFAATQAAWRFMNNDRVTLQKLAEPLREAGLCSAEMVHAPFLLAIHDWSKLTFVYSKSKQDLVQLTHATDVGYELTTVLLISPDDGSPLAPMDIELKTAAGVLSTREPAPSDRPHLEQVLPMMNASREWGLAKPLIHIIDREADSVDHYRQWDAAGHRFLVRADDRRVKWEGKSRLLSEIAKNLQEQGKFRESGEAEYKGKPAQLWVAETEVILHRPAKKNVGGQKYELAGRPLKLRLVVAQVRDDQGNVLARWLLLSNVPLEMASAEELARYYYWRWRIESFFKLLKSHGQQLEQWQQETGHAIARRLLVAAMACVVVWQLLADSSEAGVELKNLLIRLSGRQMKRNRPHTAPALLAGLNVLLAMLNLLGQMSLDHVRDLLNLIPGLDTG